MASTPITVRVGDTRDDVVIFTGERLGRTTSKQPHHSHTGRDFARKGERCYACRWSDYAIYRVDTWLEYDPSVITGDERYFVVSNGETIVPGEVTFRRTVATNSPAEVIELLTTRKFNQAPVITSSAARLLAQASDLDEKIQEAYDNRVVL